MAVFSTIDALSVRANAVPMVRNGQTTGYMSIRVRATQEEIAAKRCASMVGSTERVLIEERNEKNGLLSGRTASSIIVEFPGEDEWIGEFKNVKVTEARNWILRGECVD